MSRTPSEATDPGEGPDEAPDEPRGIRSGKLAGRSLGSAIWILAFPVLVQQTMQAFVGMADKIFAGHLVEGVRLAALDAIGIGAYVGWFINIAMAGLGIGGQALIARAMGAGDVPLGHRVLGQAMAISLLWGGMVGVVLWMTAGPVAGMCQLSPHATALYAEYIRVLAVAMPLSGVMVVGAMCLHGAGETTFPSLIAIGVNVVNVIASWALSGVDIHFGRGADALVLENPFGFDLAVRGIALGTAIGYGFGAAATLVVLARGVKDLRLERRMLALHGPTIRRILRIGVPNFLEGISMWTANLLVLTIIGRIAGGAEGLLGANIIATQWEAFSFLPGFALGTAAAALAGQYLGAGDPHQARRAVLACTGVAIVLMSAIGVVFMTCGEVLCAVMSNEPIHLEHVPTLLFIAGVIQPFFATTMVMRQALRGVGDTRWTFAITTLSSYGVRLPAAYYLGVTLGLGIEGVWYGLCGELVVRAALFASRFFHGGWRRIEV